jgi:hypothetical protein
MEYRSCGHPPGGVFYSPSPCPMLLNLLFHGASSIGRGFACLSNVPNEKDVGTLFIILLFVVFGV